MRLVKAGYGSYNEIWKMSARTVLQLSQYEDFIPKYSEAFAELNKDNEK